MTFTDPENLRPAPSRDEVAETGGDAPASPKRARGRPRSSSARNEAVRRLWFEDKL
jgi:hypothetical protein